MEIIVKYPKPKTSVVYDTYWKFATERQNVFFNRINNAENWTNDRVLQEYKFTNVYRVTDRVSQYLLKEVIYNYNSDPKETLFRILIFKTFNKINTWEVLLNRLGTVAYAEYSFSKYDNVLTDLLNSGHSIYSGAYIMTSGKSTFGHSRKHRNHLKLIEKMMNDGLDERILQASELSEVFALLKSYPTIGNFLAYQYTIDINYSEICNFSEMDFVCPGPGAIDGIRKCFTDPGAYSNSDIIKYTAENQKSEFERLNLNFKNLWGRELQLIDCQNLFCEVDKYARVVHPTITGVSGRKRIKQRFTANNKPINYWFPPKWMLNEKVKSITNQPSAITQAIEQQFE